MRAYLLARSIYAASPSAKNAIVTEDENSSDLSIEPATITSRS